MDEDRIALDFITVYKSYKDRSFRRKERKMEAEKKMLGKKDAEKKGRLDKIRK